jgi:hypothetical protein
MTNSKQISAVVAFSIVASFAISQSLTRRAGHPPPAGPMQIPHSPPKFCDPLPGLTTQQATNFTLGQAQFQVIDGPADGLATSGPGFSEFDLRCREEKRWQGTAGCFDSTIRGILPPATQAIPSGKPYRLAPGGAGAGEVRRPALLTSS